MAFDGITIACLVKELKEHLLGGRIGKIAQPERDELLFTINRDKVQHRLLLSADASLPLVYLTKENKKSPLTAPNFCMLLRKHIQNGRITAITQPGLERIINFEIEHLDEMGDICHKTIAVEMMGKHSNIIFINDQNMIIDSIKHISGMVSSVREVLPGRAYFIPQTMDKQDALLPERSPEQFASIVSSKALPAAKSLYMNFTGISPIVSQEICVRAGVDADLPILSLDASQMGALQRAFEDYMGKVIRGEFTPNIVYDKQIPLEFGALVFAVYQEKEVREFDSMSEVLYQYYAQRSAVTRIRQKSSDLRRIVQTALERNVKKFDLQMRQLKDTEKREKYKIYGELLHTYGYSIPEGAKSATVDNYYTGEPMQIPLDPDLTAMENAKKFFDKYGKLKRTYEALTQLTEATKAEVEHLESVMTALDIAQMEEDLVQIKEELVESGYIRRKGNAKKQKITSRPFHYISSDGFHIYVGKNNFQNEELTFQFAQGNDWWFHAKGIPGSHVIVKCGGREMPDSTFEEAGRLAAHYSKGRDQDKVEVDYIEKKHVKKPNGAKPGFVVYYTNYSLVIDSNISRIERVDD
ncbi:MAG: NFACT family protein [Lachnospiraceae bacterium]|nr:NFACT family protein [Lachnospiraceae bacterium]